MKNFLTSFLLLTILILVAVVHQKANAEDAIQASDAQQELRQKLLEISSYSANFVQIVQNEKGDELQQTSGKLSFGKPDKMRWEVLSPDESLSIIDGKHIYNIDPFVEQVTILNQASVIADNPLALLLNDNDDAWENVSVTREDNQYLIMSGASDANITELSLFFDELGNLNRFQTKDLQGQVNNLVFTDIKINPMLALENFIAQIPDGYVIDDQR